MTENCSTQSAPEGVQLICYPTSGAVLRVFWHHLLLPAAEFTFDSVEIGHCNLRALARPAGSPISAAVPPANLQLLGIPKLLEQARKFHFVRIFTPR